MGDKEIILKIFINEFVKKSDYQSSLSISIEGISEMIIDTEKSLFVIISKREDFLVRLLQEFKEAEPMYEHIRHFANIIASI